MSLKQGGVLLAFVLTIFTVIQGKVMYEYIDKSLGKDPPKVLPKKQAASEYEVNSESGLIEDKFETDILLTKEQKELLDLNDTNIESKRNAVKIGYFGLDRRWPNKTLYYNDTRTGLSVNDINALNQAIYEFHGKTCIKIKKWTGQQRYYVRITDDVGCSSRVGYLRRQGEKLSLASGCNSKGTIIHEFMHALGFWHEQSRPDRDKYVKIILKNIKKGMRDQFKKHEVNMVQETKSNYDYLSVMHYDKKEFSKNGGYTILAANGSVIVNMGQRHGLSPSDVQELNVYYECPDYKSTFGKPVDSKVMNCDIGSDTGTCNWEFITDDSWFEPKTGNNSSSRVTGPSSAPKISTNDQYLYFDARTALSGSTQVMRSLLLKPTTGSCLTFWYNMYGITMGKLMVGIIDKTDKQLQKENTLWVKEGNQGKSWKEAKVTIESSKPFYVAFEAIRGSSLFSDIAIDHIYFSSTAPCPDPALTMAPTLAPTQSPVAIAELNCVLDHSSNCGFETPISKSKDGKELEFKKIYRRGDYVIRFYPYFGVLAQGDTASLISPMFSPTKPSACVSFSFYLKYFHEKGGIVVYLADKNGQNKKELFEVLGDHGRTWSNTQISYKSSYPYKIVFGLKISQKTTRRYLMLTNIKVHQGPCDKKPMCGNIVYNSKTNSCCVGVLYKKRSGYRCCGGKYPLTKKGYRCCRATFQYVSKHAVC